MSRVLKITATALAGLMLGSALFASPVFADAIATRSVAAPTHRQLNVAIDALRDVLDAMVARGVMRA